MMPMNLSGLEWSALVAATEVTVQTNAAAQVDKQNFYKFWLKCVISKSNFELSLKWKSRCCGVCWEVKS